MVNTSKENRDSFYYVLPEQPISTRYMVQGKRLSSENSDCEILGRKTKLIEIFYVDGSISKYWYDPTIYIDAEPYQNLKFAFLNKYWELAQAPYLKHERVTSNSIITYTATNIRETQVSQELFEPK